jgi:hypothetical protein
MCQRRLFDMLLLGCLILPIPVDLPPVIEELVRRLHRHAAEVRNEVGAISVARNIAFRTLPGILASKRQHIAAVTTPVGTQVRDRFETVRNPVVDLFLVSVSSVGLGYTLRDHLLITLLVTSVATVLALVPESVK